MSESYLFSDLGHVLSFFKSTEMISIVPESFFNFNHEEITYISNVNAKNPHFIASVNQTVHESITITKTLRRQGLVMNDIRCSGYTENSNFYTTLERFLDFLNVAGLIYRPDMSLPAISTKAVKREGFVFFPYPVYEKDGKKLTGFTCSGYAESDFNYQRGLSNA
jgi:hypothetical protein